MTAFDHLSFEHQMAKVIDDNPVLAGLSRSASTFMTNFCRKLVDQNLSEATLRFWNARSRPITDQSYFFSCENARQMDLSEWLRELDEREVAAQFSGQTLLPSLIEVEFGPSLAKYSLTQQSDLPGNDAFCSVSLSFTRPWDTRTNGAQWEAIVRTDAGFDSEDGPIALLPANGEMTAENNDVLGIVTSSIQTVLRDASFTRRA